MENTITLTKEELIKACAEASAELMEDSAKEDKDALSKALLFMLVGAKMTDRLVRNLFKDEEKPDGESQPDAEPVNNTHD